MPYRSEQEAWVRRHEEAEARASAAEATLRELSAMKAKAPWKLAFGALILLALGVTAGWALAPAEHRPGAFAALTTQSFAARSRSLYVWRGTPNEGTELAAQDDECTLSVDVQDNDGTGRPVQEIYVRFECRGGLTYSTSQFGYGERHVGGCSLDTGDHASLFCSIGIRSSDDAARLFIDTRRGVLGLLMDGVDARFTVTSREEVQTPRPRPVRGRGMSRVQSAATITYVSGIPSEGTLPRPRVRVGAECIVTATSATSARESRCKVELDCAGTLFEAFGVCTLDEVGHIERVVDLTVSAPDGRRGDGNASVIYDVNEQTLLLMESQGHEAFLLRLSLKSNRSQARFL